MNSRAFVASNSITCYQPKRELLSSGNKIMDPSACVYDEKYVCSLSFKAPFWFSLEEEKPILTPSER